MQLVYSYVCLLQTVVKLGGEIVDSIFKCTHLVTDQVCIRGRVPVVTVALDTKFLLFLFLCCIVVPHTCRR